MQKYYTLTGGCSTDKGVVKDKNEDAVFFRCFEKNGISIAFGAVCDGISGLESGEISSGYVIGQLRQWLEGIEQWMDLETTDPALLFSHMKDAAEDWNYGLYSYLHERNIASGTTLSLLLLTGTHYYIVHVGDSRVYRYSPAKGLQQLTADASITMMEEGRMRSYLANFVGKQENLDFSAYDGTAEPGDMFLFCSDGGYHRMTEEDTARLYASVGTDAGAADALCGQMLSLMLSRGERDNLTLGIIRIDEAEPPRQVSARQISAPWFRRLGKK